MLEDPKEALRKAQIEADAVQARLDELTKEYDGCLSKIVAVTFLKGGWGYI